MNDRLEVVVERLEALIDAVRELVDQEADLVFATDDEPELEEAVA